MADAATHSAPDALALVRALPKAELHIHLEGTLEAEHMIALADRNGVSLPYPDAETARRAYSFTNLQSFLDVYYQGLRVLLTEQDFYDLTLTYLDRAAIDGIVHSEMFFDPQAHTERGVRFETAIEGILAGIAEGKARHGISTGLIMCFLRHLPESSAFATLASAQRYLPHLVGVGLDSSERGFPPSIFAQVFAASHALGLRRVAHAGEEGPPDYITQAIDLLGAERIDHGVAAIHDRQLLATLIERQIPLTMCPISNLRLAVTPDLSRHPLKAMLDMGVCVTINSDDPAYFGGYLIDNFSAAIDALPLSGDDIVRIIANGFVAAFITDQEKKKWLSKISRLRNIV